MMKKEYVLRRLASERKELARFRVKSLAIFGSVARDEARQDSDLDVLVDFQNPPTFDRYMKLKLFLEDLMGCQVDLLTRNSIRSELRPFIEQELVYVS